MEDACIVDLYWARSERAIDETSSKYGKYCFTIAHNILANDEDADESVNNTYLDAWNSMPPHRPAILSTFLGKITRRIAIDKWRSRSAEKRGGGEIFLALDELSECISSRNSVEQEIEAAELAKNINDFLRTISLDERNTFVGRYWFLLSVKELSVKTGFSEGKIKILLYRTRKKLKDYLKRKEY